MAADLALGGDTGRMVSLRNGSYTTVPISATREGVDKRVDVDELYDVHEYRPKPSGTSSASPCSSTDDGRSRRPHR